ncbi:MAG: tRNA pseudouridine synthase A [Bacteroidia bacterium]|nr:MAG: tRNA pseudouridine synthase A [Bacteroidia bacterium]
MPRYFLELAYCGTNLNGWQIQANTPNTVQQILTEVLSTTLRENIELIGCGRTDAGVHAKQYFAHFDSSNLASHPFDFWLHKWNSMLPESIAIHQILPVKDAAHARYDAVSRTYEYFIHQRKDPFLYQKSWYYPTPLNHEKIMNALEIIKNHNDFACFAKDASEYKNTICIITHTEWKIKNYQITFTISANRFLRNMVRSLVGTLIWIGTGKFSLEDLKNILHSRDRKKAGFSAPADGLYLSQIIYPKDIFLL